MQGQYNCETEKIKKKKKNEQKAGLSLQVSWFCVFPFPVLAGGQQEKSAGAQAPRSSSGYIFLLLFLFFFNLKVYTGPTYPSTHIFLTLPWVLALGYLEQGVFNALGAGTGLAAAKGLLKTELRK